jgi:oligopeptide/dipeptide ABC transporter ATP-binding protein
LKRALEDARVAGGFKPRAAPGLHNDLVDPGELMTRAFLLWQRTRWPGHDGRVRYAHTLFNLYLLRRLMLLCLRIWDGEPRDAGARLEQLQHALDALWRTQPAQPVFVRDARSLFALALSPTTDELHGYLEITRLIAETLPREDLVAIQKVNVRMAGGHLRSQLRHVATQQGVPLDEHGLVSSTRKSNTLDLATLIQGLVPLLEAYERAARDGAVAARLDLADAICQGISPDPELFLNRLELLAPYSMIEYLFIATQADGAAIPDPLRRAPLATTRGEPPNPLNPPDGCAFSPRCRYAEAVCHRTPMPPLEIRPDGHAVRCWRADEISGQTVLAATESGHS